MSYRLVILDPSVPSRATGPAPNAGDEIIAAAVTREMELLFPGAKIDRVGTHARPAKSQLELLAGADRVIVGGSNLLGNAIRPRWVPTKPWRQWHLAMSDARRIRRAVLLGVGWRVYEGRIDRSTRRLYTGALDSEALHSVRDQYSVTKLRELGMRNVVNTGCPTLWPLAGRPQDWIPVRRSSSVLTTVTDYREDADADSELQELLARLYDHVYFWPQGEQDLAYASQLKMRAEVVPPGLASLDNFLEATDCDYVGTRLHAGIHCLEARKRSLVISVDNRAAEMGPETGIPTAKRGDLESVRNWVDTPSATRILLDQFAIARWRQQFVDGNHDD